MFPVLLIAIGIAVLLLGKRLAVLGAAVGAILGVAILDLLPGDSGLLVSLLVVGGLAALGFFSAGFAKGIVNLILLVFGAVAGAAILLNLLGLFNLDFGLLVDLLLALAGGVIGIIVIRRFGDWGLIILSAVIGALLVTRGLTIWFPSMEGALGSLIAIVLAALSAVYQGGILGGRKSPTGTA